MTTILIILNWILAIMNIVTSYLLIKTTEELETSEKIALSQILKNNDLIFELTEIKALRKMAETNNRKNEVKLFEIQELVKKYPFEYTELFGSKIKSILDNSSKSI